jgi:hypothetical protein
MAGLLVLLFVAWPFCDFYLLKNLEKISCCDILCYLCSPKVLPNGKLFMIVSIKSFPK